MEDKLRNLRDSMDETVLNGIHFSELQKIQIRKAVKQNSNRIDWFPKLLTASLVIVFLIFLGSFLKPEVVPEHKNGSITNGQWNLSSAFTIPTPGPDGKNVSQRLIGEKGKVAILDIPVVAGKHNKQMIYIWGGSYENTVKLFDQQVKVIGTSLMHGKSFTAFEGSVGVPNSEIDKPPYEHAVAGGYLNIPAKGKWKLDVYVEDKFVGSIVINVK